MDKKYGERLRSIRKAKGLSAIQLVNKIGISQPALSRIENNNQSITQDILYSLNEYLNINLHWLLTGEGTMYLDSPSLSKELSEKTICPECSQGYNLDKVLEAKESQFESKEKQITLLEKSVERLESDVERLELEKEELKKRIKFMETNDVQRTG